jgi:hypothetical protein
VTEKLNSFGDGNRFQTYFPHIDNVYSHRSTQKYKRKPFISHYWDCRLKGRPAGTPKSDDPNKKKRKRVARERDLCDVKIKITEYFPEATAADISNHQRNAVDSTVLSSDNHHGANATTATNMIFPNGSDAARGNPQSFGMLTPGPALSENPSLVAGDGHKLYIIQRVNGNGGNGKTDGVGGGHRHTLEDSDRVKKNSVHRYLLKKSKGEKKVVVVSLHLSFLYLAHPKIINGQGCRGCPSVGFMRTSHIYPDTYLHLPSRFFVQE